MLKIIHIEMEDIRENGKNEGRKWRKVIREKDMSEAKENVEDRERKNRKRERGIS